MILKDVDNHTTLEYQPNTTLNFGIGATAKGFTLNLVYRFNALNEDVGKGTSWYLDLQSHIYSSKYIVDFYGQFYKGPCSNNTESLNPDSNVPCYLRPDIRIRLFGISFQEVIIERKFSHAASYQEQQINSNFSSRFAIGYNSSKWYLGSEHKYGQAC